MRVPAQGVRDITFTADGARFFSTGFDKVIRLWDTETGKVISTLGEGKMFYTLRLHPDPDKQNVLMAGCGDKKVTHPPSLCWFTKTRIDISPR